MYSFLTPSSHNIAREIRGQPPLRLATAVILVVRLDALVIYSVRGALNAIMHLWSVSCAPSLHRHKSWSNQTDECQRIHVVHTASEKVSCGQ